jgi:hypothetical protein
MQISMKPSFLSLALVKENSFVMATRSLVERGQSPTRLQNTILMMTTLQATNDSDDENYGPDDDVNKETLITNRTRALPETPPNSPPPARTPIDDDDYDDDAPLLPPPAAENDDSGVEATEQVSSRPQRIRKTVDRYKPVHLANAKAATYDTPTFQDALIRYDADLSKEAITKEINTLKDRGT